MIDYIRAGYKLINKNPYLFWQSVFIWIISFLFMGLLFAGSLGLIYVTCPSDAVTDLDKFFTYMNDPGTVLPSIIFVLMFFVSSVIGRSFFSGFRANIIKLVRCNTRPSLLDYFKNYGKFAWRRIQLKMLFVSVWLIPTLVQMGLKYFLTLNESGEYMISPGFAVPFSIGMFLFQLLIIMLLWAEEVGGYVLVWKDTTPGTAIKEGFRRFFDKFWVILGFSFFLGVIYLIIYFGVGILGMILLIIPYIGWILGIFAFVIWVFLLFLFLLIWELGMGLITFEYPDELNVDQIIENVPVHSIPVTVDGQEQF